VNIEAYISSGILESYLLDELTPQEKNGVERMLLLHPELKAELARLEQTLEAFAIKAAIEPRPVVKESILSRAGKRRIEVTLSPKTYFVWKYAAAASIVVALTAGYLAYTFYGKWMTANLALNNFLAEQQHIAQDYSTVTQKLEKLQSDISIIENAAFRKVVMKGTANDTGAQASVYWNASSQEVFLSIQNLKSIAQENQFQLWAIVDGKPVDAGVFDLGFAGLLKMKNVKGASAFAITIEPRGGKDAPTLDTMQVIGPVAG